MEKKVKHTQKQKAYSKMTLHVRVTKFPAFRWHHGFDPQLDSNLMKSLESVASSWSHVHIPDPQKLWGIKCLLFKVAKFCY